MDLYSFLIFDVKKRHAKIVHKNAFFAKKQKQKIKSLKTINNPFARKKTVILCVAILQIYLVVLI
jgi:hypothetical protein